MSRKIKTIITISRASCFLCSIISSLIVKPIIPNLDYANAIGGTIVVILWFGVPILFGLVGLGTGLIIVKNNKLFSLLLSIIVILVIGISFVILNSPHSANIKVKNTLNE